MENKRFLTACDVAEFMGISVPMAYKIIRRLNDELAASGYIIVAGRVSRNFPHSPTTSFLSPFFSAARPLISSHFFFFSLNFSAYWAALAAVLRI